MPEEKNPISAPTSHSFPQSISASSSDHNQTRHDQPPPASTYQHRDEGHDGTPWHLWTETHTGKKEGIMSHASLSANPAESIRHYVDSTLRARPHANFERKAWMQSDKTNNAWVWAYPRGDLLLNARQFPVVAQTFFGVK